jgi:hypothetical protein
MSRFGLFGTSNNYTYLKIRVIITGIYNEHSIQDKLFKAILKALNERSVQIKPRHENFYRITVTNEPIIIA